MMEFTIIPCFATKSKCHTKCWSIYICPPVIQSMLSYINKWIEIHVGIITYLVRSSPKSWWWEYGLEQIVDPISYTPHNCMVILYYLLLISLDFILSTEFTINLRRTLLKPGE